jgi:hypothetical protein
MSFLDEVAHLSEIVVPLSPRSIGFSQLDD